MRRPWLRHDAEGAGRFVVAVIRAKPKRQRPDDPELAGAVAQWAGHWGRLVLGDSEPKQVTR